ncbi:MAG: NADH-quinone oxidoreductase subunit C [Ignavibacteriales bacterium]|mgnify:CR=1 FL=1|nr:MAG: NADH-quinone oxidoreductase subunit C [Ignavibacteriaceae bacterium]MBW7871930.1 NADH-quinone oxidoreductase subunit C [Ignavibacteria bacterium]MCZ2144219.1 NADH-quinone oxidoreductase subunit C [Ignavibacteriales bacterium]OQY79016.1 MAG: NADH-quinone oxidoreductase subunit C [Ignavibacteriales bacterium UTCHB3]MBV6446173.1 NADH-quinone oxidoreductase chain 5 [Ignavibacteriaceae bacterium]
MEIRERIEALLAEAFPEVKFEYTDFRGDLRVLFSKEHVIPVCKFLRDNEELAFSMCEDITAIDWARQPNRFSVVYHIYSLKNKYRLRLACDVEEHEAKIDTVTSVWKSANWYERETWDMYGINFEGHPDLRRMYMAEEFEYFPLRKEYPMIGIPGDQPLPKK